MGPVACGLYIMIITKCSIFHIRNQDGIFNVMHTVELKIADGPSFQSDGPTQMPTQHYAILGDPSSLICGRGLDSNPQATITWTAPDGTAIMNSTRYDLENGPDIVRLNLSRTSLSDNGVWVCELVVISERHLVTSRGVLVKGALAMIGTPLRHQFRLTVIGEFTIT